MFCRIKAQDRRSQTLLCVKTWRYDVFFIAPVSFLHSCLSLEAETWRRTASLALSATDKYCVSDWQIYIYIYIFVCVCVCVINQETSGNGIKCRKFWFVTVDTGLCVMCESTGSVNLWLAWELFVILVFFKLWLCLVLLAFLVLFLDLYCQRLGIFKYYNICLLLNSSDVDISSWEI